MTTQVAIKMDEKLKKRLAKKAKANGVTVTFVLNHLAKDYVEKDFRILVLHPGESRMIDGDAEVSFDEIFEAPEIVRAANKLSDYIRKSDKF
jgi:hypothetical protein